MRYLILLFTALTLSACMNDGGPGPTGATGPAGATGAAGPSGPPGLSSLPPTINHDKHH